MIKVSKAWNRAGKFPKCGAEKKKCCLIQKNQLSTTHTNQA